MDTKKSTVLTVDFTGDWKAPNGDTIFFHDVTLKNGDFGNIGCKDKFDNKIAIGSEIEYTKNGKRIKLDQANSNQTPAAPKQYNKKTYTKKPEDFLGYACSYAKDMVIAGKATAKDIKAYEAAAEKIYAHVKKLLDKD